MGLFEENEVIIGKLEGFIDNMCTAEIEDKITNHEIDAESLDRKIYDGYNQVIRFTHRIRAVNQSVIDSVDSLRNQMDKMAQIENTTMPSDEIYYIERPVNNQNRLVHNFYESIKSKYGSEYEKHITRNMAAQPPEGRLKKSLLDEEEQKQALILDKYLKICLISEQFEILIDYLKRIQYNYLPKESVTYDE